MLQVTVGCGKVCLFYVGGCAEFTTQDGGVPRWEFFIGDRPHHPGPDKHGHRPPIAQVGPLHCLTCFYSSMGALYHLRLWGGWGGGEAAHHRAPCCNVCLQSAYPSVTLCCMLPQPCFAACLCLPACAHESSFRGRGGGGREVLLYMSIHIFLRPRKHKHTINCYVNSRPLAAMWLGSIAMKTIGPPCHRHPPAPPDEGRHLSNQHIWDQRPFQYPPDSASELSTNMACIHNQAMGVQIGSAEQYAQAGDVILSPEVAGVTAGHCSVTPLEGNNARLVSMSKSAVVSGAFLALPICFAVLYSPSHTVLCPLTTQLGLVAVNPIPCLQQPSQAAFLKVCARQKADMAM